MKKVILIALLAIVCIGLNTVKVTAQVVTSVNLDYVYHDDTEEKGTMSVYFRGYDQNDVYRQDNHIVSLGVSSVNSTHIYRSVTITVKQILPDQAVYEKESFYAYPRIYDVDMTINVYEELPVVPGD